MYYGDEVGVTGGKDPESRNAFPWDPTHWESNLLETTRATFALRRAEPALRSDDVTFLSSGGEALAFERRLADRRLAVAVNAGEAEAALALTGVEGYPAVLLSAGRARQRGPGVFATEGTVMVELPPRSGAVIALA